MKIGYLGASAPILLSFYSSSWKKSIRDAAVIKISGTPPIQGRMQTEKVKIGSLS